MRKIQKWLKVVFFVFIALMGTQQIVFADQLNNSVEDCLQHPDQCKDTNSGSKQGNVQKGSTVQTNGSAQVGVTVWDFVKMIFATVFVVALLYLLLKFINKKSRSFKSTQLVENLGGAALGANRSVQIVKIGGQLFIVGVGENVQLLKQIEDPLELQQILTDYNNNMEHLVKPSDIVTKVLEKVKKWQSSNKEGESFTSLFKAQLDELSKGRKKLFEEMEKKGSDKK